MSDLEQRLRSLAARDDLYPATPKIAVDIDTPIEAPRYPRGLGWRMAAAVAVVALVTLVLAFAVPTTRTAIADFFGIAGIRIEFVDDAGDEGPGTPISIGGSLLLGQETTLARAEESTPFTVMVPGDVPDPDEVYLFRRDGATVTGLLWLATAALPEIGKTGVGMLLLQIEADEDHTVLTKRAMGLGNTITSVDGQTAYWIEGGVLVVEPVEGLILAPEERRSGHVLIWSDDGVTYRLETALPMDAAVRIAESLAPAGNP